MGCSRYQSLSLMTHGHSNNLKTWIDISINLSKIIGESSITRVLRKRESEAFWRIQAELTTAPCESCFQDWHDRSSWHRSWDWAARQQRFLRRVASVDFGGRVGRVNKPRAFSGCGSNPEGKRRFYCLFGLCPDGI